jgi:NhaA family Na+:H+ antiporter
MSWIGIKLKWAELPDKIAFPQLIGIAFIAGLGFTMSIFIANLAYDSKSIIDSAKLGIFIGSAISGFCGFFFLKYQFIQFEKE